MFATTPWFVALALALADAGTFNGFEKERMWDVAKSAMPGVPLQDAAWLYLDPQHGVIASRMVRGSKK